MTLLRISLVTICLITSNLLGQTVQISNDSASDRPVTVKGSITFSPNDWDNTSCSIIGHNNSDSTIVAFAMIFSVVRPDGELAPDCHMTRDPFFKDPDFLAMHSPQPRLDFPLNIDCSGWLAGHGSVVSSKPAEARIKTKFVQFDDGSVWGDDKTVAEVMFQRTEALNYLESLKAAQFDGGDAALYYALKEDVPTRGADHRFRHMVLEIRITLLHLGSAKAAADRIDKDLATAEARKNWLK